MHHRRFMPSSAIFVVFAKITGLLNHKTAHLTVSMLGLALIILMAASPSEPFAAIDPRSGQPVSRSAGQPAS
jgi:hypothetical protein